ncbi:MAG TPA: polysaccharide pyruvyl transferase family protein [Epulopiscium sp.]|nr:polysaccharide pyruvyl transferase family protein [Candidatus Epulonipiscium sp.]
MVSDKFLKLNQMKKKINLYWYAHPEGEGNFGDELNPYIIEHLTGEKVNYLPIPGTRINRFLKLIKRLVLNQISFKNALSVLNSLRFKKYYIAIGSIIKSAEGRNCQVWGSGLMSRSDIINKCTFFAVRGEITRKRIKELGYNVPLAIGDPALLLPIIYRPNSNKIYDLGVIPHFVQMTELSKKLTSTNENILIIDLLKDPETVIEQINSCKKTLSSSLHGIIVSHAYGIPSLWCNLGETTLHGDDVKFDDYFSSVNIKWYPKNEINLKCNISDQVDSLFIKQSGQSLINVSIDKIQRSLINCAPFQILEKYKR